LKGLLQVFESLKVDENTGFVINNYFVKQECTPEEENQGLLQTIYEDGKFFNQTTLNEIRERLLKQ
jgi:hypothetical protein